MPILGNFYLGTSNSAITTYGDVRVIVVYISGHVTKSVRPFLFAKLVANVHEIADFSAATLPFLYLICVSCSEPAHLVPSTRSQNEVKG